jgi:hypothetical protein
MPVRRLGGVGDWSRMKSCAWTRASLPVARCLLAGNCYSFAIENTSSSAHRVKNYFRRRIFSGILYIFYKIGLLYIWNEENVRRTMYAKRKFWLAKVAIVGINTHDVDRQPSARSLVSKDSTAIRLWTEWMYFNSTYLTWEKTKMTGMTVISRV